MTKVSYIIADNSDLFNTVIPELPSENNLYDGNAYNTQTQVSNPQNDKYSELYFVGKKLVISFAAMIISIVVIYLILVLFKKRMATKTQEDEYETKDKKIIAKPKKIRIKNSLCTAKTLNECIRAFLENTKKN